MNAERALSDAATAREAGHYDLAAKILSTARGWPLDEAERALIDLELVWVLALGGHRAAAVRLARTLSPDHADARAHGLLGAALMRLDQPKAALPHLRAAARAAPDRADGWFSLATAWRAVDSTPEAADACERAIARDPAHSGAHALLAALRPWTAAENHVERLRATLAAASDPEAKARLGYALFKELDDLDRRDEAWAALTDAAATARRIQPYDPSTDERLIDALIAGFPGGRFSQAASVPANGPRPIFIVGLPRTGSTLIEQIFAAHSAVTPLGELFGFGLALNAAAGVRDRAYPSLAAIRRAGEIDWAAVGASYRAQIAALAEGAPVVTDKLPMNWTLAGPILLALPDARIVAVRRQPMDALFGAWKLLFRNDHGWSNSLPDLAAHYAQHRRGMDHWRAVLDDRLVEVSYESLVADPETEIPRLLRACGLEPEPMCLTPHLADGGVTTPSAQQVRRPINTRAVGAWRRYAVGLEPLRADLERRGLVDADGAATS